MTQKWRTKIFVPFLTTTIKLDNNSCVSRLKMKFPFLFFFFLSLLTCKHKQGWSEREKVVVDWSFSRFFVCILRFQFIVFVDLMCRIFIFNIRNSLCLFPSPSLSLNQHFYQHKHIFELRKQMNRKKRIGLVIIKIHTHTLKLRLVQLSNTVFVPVTHVCKSVHPFQKWKSILVIGGKINTNITYTHKIRLNVFDVDFKS